MEFHDSIIRDLAALGVTPNIVTYTSDSFEIIHKYALQMIEEGKAFMDNTPQMEMRDERMKRVNSKNRDLPVEENLKLFELMCSGSEEGAEYCLRAKIDMTSKNGTLRDPVMYRANPLPHHRTGTKYHAYPTYDFACPIVDSIEGVTHAMRTTEYRDRDAQYAWFQRALSLRKVTIHSFSRLNFINTVLSKRKLAWFVEQGLVDGWNDPRFPTVQGMIRRGVSIDAMRDFMISQGASKKNVDMEWDKFFSNNKKFIDATAPRFVCVCDKVKVTVSNGPEEVEESKVPLHPKLPELGERPIRRFKHVIIERSDADTFEEGEKITLLNWGNVIVDSIVKNEEGEITEIIVTSKPEDIVFKGTKKVTWLADLPDLVKVKLREFDHLITKRVLEDGDKLEDFVNPVTEADTEAWTAPVFKEHVELHETLQFMRRGYYIADKLDNDEIELIMIPDGKKKSMSGLKGKLAHR
eukprot:TRINITY_DN776173_c0_g1_i1.p1 TRINITY_DN776173_c0_g1~~TRINITY_DN776173_c0_g1_i1.p1  ORF type:complete len:539 (-),score=166.79 TRINITY_DN776173_c0_g1_i1:145-1542(-)